MFSFYAAISMPSSSGEKDEERLRLDGMVMRTLKDIPETTRIPKLAEAAKLALQISVNAQRAKRYKIDVNDVARQTRAFVYLVFRANQNMKKDIPRRLKDQFDHVLQDLSHINKFAKACSTDDKITSYTGNARMMADLVVHDLDSLRRSLVTFGYDKVIWDLNEMIAMENKYSKNSTSPGGAPVMNDCSASDLAWASGVKPRYEYGSSVVIERLP
ncbi:hypothetical protein F5887DRAFT_970225 [Amanita rubescens]|nr:hypothetical protein F5887DRAFT_970225 [Amanita rubescens]